MGPEIWWLEDSFKVVARPIVRGYTIVCVSNTEGTGFLLLILISSSLPVQWSRYSKIGNHSPKGRANSKLCIATSIHDMPNMICQQQNLLCHVITAMFRLLFTSWPVKSQPRRVRFDIWCLQHMAGTNKHNSHPHNHDSLTVEHARDWERLLIKRITILRILKLSKAMSKYSTPAQSFWVLRGWQLHILS